MTTNTENQALVIAERAFRKEFGDAPFRLTVELSEAYGVEFRAAILLSNRRVESEEVLIAADPAMSARAVADRMKHEMAVELRRLADSLEGKYEYSEN